MTNTISPATLAEKMAAAKASAESITDMQQSNLGQGPSTEGTKPEQSQELEKPAESGVTSKSYQLPSSNCTIPFPASAGGPVVSYDSVFTTSDPAQIAELDKCVRVGTITYARGKSAAREHQPVEPVARAAARNNGTVV